MCMGSFGIKFKGLIKLTKPLQWSKSFGNMLIGFVLASRFLSFDLALFLAGFIAVGPLLWSGLYTLNDFTDWKKDKLHPVKKNRPIPVGEVSPKLAFVIGIFLILGAFVIAIFLNNFLFLVCLAAMLVNQVLYTFKPFEFKKKPVIDLISGSIINPFLRFYSGWVLVVPAFNAPIEIVLFILAVQFGGFTLYRLASTQHEKEQGYKSSVVVFSQSAIKIVSYFGLGIGILAFLIAIFNGVLGLKFLWLAVLSFFAVPLYWKAISSPQKMDMHKAYRTIYIHYFLFVIGFFVLEYYF